MAYPTISNNCTKSSKYHLSKTQLIPGLPDDIALECLTKVPITSHPTLRQVSSHWKSTLSHPHFYSLRRNSATAENLVFLIQPLPQPPSSHHNKFISNLEDIESKNIDHSTSSLLYNLNIYNSTQNEWRNLANIDIPTFAQCVALPALSKVVILGGWDPATLEPIPRVVVIDLASGTWREGSPMPTARSFFACATVGSSTVCVAGGHDRRKNALRTAEVNDVQADQWRKLPDMAEERDESHGVILSDDQSKFWVVSGFGTESQGRFRSDAEIFDQETNSWSRIDGVWPYSGHTPKTTVVAGFNRRLRWLSVIGGEVKEFDFKGMKWKGLNIGVVPKSVIGLTSIAVVDMGDERLMVMGNGERSCGVECKEEGCGGEGVFMVVKMSEGEKKSGVNWVWEHVHAPPRYLGFPFAASHLRK